MVSRPLSFVVKSGMAVSSYFTCVLVALSLFWELSRGQSLEFLGPGFCLISRVEIIPCEFALTPASLGANEFVEYRTVFINAQPLPLCSIDRQVAGPSELSVTGITNQVYTFFSPGINLIPPRRYRNNRYVQYNFQCGEGRLAFLNVTNIDMQGKTCTDPNLNNAAVCVDYFRVARPAGGGFTESCGTDASENIDQLESGGFQALFRTDSTTRDGGIMGVVICYDPAEGNVQGCTTTPGTSSQRSRRDLENLQAPRIRAKRRSGYMNHRKSTSSRNFQVPHGAGVTFMNNLLQITDNRDNITAIEGLPETNIECLKVFDGINPERKFVGNAVDKSGNPIRFLGPGILSFDCKCVEFQQFVINPMGIMPEPEERVIVFELSQAILNASMIASDDFDDFVTTDMPTDPPTEEPGSGELMDEERSAEPFTSEEALLLVDEDDFDPLDPSENDSLQYRQRRQTVSSVAFEDQTILLALENENACNPVLRASANAVLESSDPQRVEDLRMML